MTDFEKRLEEILSGRSGFHNEIYLKKIIQLIEREIIGKDEVDKDPHANTYVMFKRDKLRAQMRQKLGGK